MRCFRALEADGSAPLVQAKTSGKNVAFSICYSLFIFVLFNRFMVLLGFATAFRATLPAG